MYLAVKAAEFLMNLVYLVIRALVRSRPDKITFISRQSDVPSLDFQLLNKELQKKNMRTTILCRTLQRSLPGMVSYCFHMLRQMYHIAGSYAVVLDGYCIAASMLRHKKALTIVQIWHSMGTMKDFGYTAMGKKEGSSYKLAKAMKMHCNYDYVLISSDAYRHDMAAGFDCDICKIHTCPLPRLDLLTGTEYAEKIRGEIFSKYPVLGEKRNILYCPTFRKGDEEGLRQAVETLIRRFDRKRYNLIIKLHPLSQIRIKDAAVITAEEFTTFDMIFVSNYVISDYSCVVYEAAVRNIPLYFFCFDLDQYEGNRGLAIDYRGECPGVISEDGDVIMSAIESGDYDMDYLKTFTDKYVHPTKHAARDMAEFIVNAMGQSGNCVHKKQNKKHKVWVCIV